MRLSAAGLRTPPTASALVPRLVRRSSGCPMLDQELDKRLAVLPAIDAPAEIRVERDRTLEKPRRDGRVPEPARVHQRPIDRDPVVALRRFLEPRPNRLVVAKR